MHVGIVGIGTYIPQKRITAHELSLATGIPESVIREKFGVHSKPVAGIHETTSFMGIKAAEKALAQAGINADAVGLVIWCGAQHKDYPCWLAGLHVAHELGASKAWSFDMEAMCGSMMTALDVAKALMFAHEELNYVLLVSGYRNNDLINLEEPTTRFMLDIGSGGSAILLKKNAGKNCVLGSAFKGDGSFSLDCIVPVLGSVKWPPREADARDAYFRVQDEEAFKAKLTERTLPNFYAVIDEALKKSGGLSRTDIDYLAILHFKHSAHETILAELQLSHEQTTYLDEYGHIGQNDQVLSLELGLQAGKIHDGDIVVMVGAGLGFVWAATVIVWGPTPEQMFINEVWRNKP